MPFDAQAIFANLAEKERLKGHHSPEGRAIRTLSRALHGWSTGNLSSGDVVVLCDQAIEDWLKARLAYSSWSQRTFATLIDEALEKKLITRSEAASLQKTHDLRLHAIGESSITAHEVEGALELCIHVVDKHW
jgi:hypothetical protein